MIPQKVQRPPGGNCGSEAGDIKRGTRSLVRKSQVWGLLCVFPTPRPHLRTPPSYVASVLTL